MRGPWGDLANHIASGNGCHESLLRNLTRGFGKADEFVVPQILLISGILVCLTLFFLMFLLVHQDCSQCLCGLL